VAGRLKRAQILLAVDTGTGDEAIAASVGIGGSPVYRTKRRFVLSYPDAALSALHHVLGPLTCCRRQANHFTIHTTAGTLWE